MKNRIAIISLFALFLALFTTPSIQPAHAVNPCQAQEILAFNSYSGTVGGAKILLTTYKDCLVSKFGNTKAELFPCGRYYQISTAFTALSSLSKYLKKAFVDYTWCVTGEKSVLNSQITLTCTSYLDVVGIGTSSGDIALAVYGRDAYGDCTTRNTDAVTVTTPNSTPSPTPKVTVLLTPTPSPSATKISLPGPTQTPTISPTPLPTLTSKQDFPTVSSANIGGDAKEGGELRISFKAPAVTGVKLSYKWFKRCILIQCPFGSSTSYTAIPGEINSTYVVQPFDGGHQFQAEITLQAPNYKDLLVTTSFPPTLVTGAPDVSGTLREGSKLIGYAGNWPAGYSLQYRWVQSCKAGSYNVSSCYETIPYSNATTFTLTALQTNKSIGFVVKGTKSGSPTVERYSRSFGVVVNKSASTAVYLPTPSK